MFCLSVLSFQGYVVNDYKKAKPSILAIGFQEICDLTATNMVWQRLTNLFLSGFSFPTSIVCFSSVNATRWVENVRNYFKKAYPNDEYILLGNDQLVGVCLAIFIRRDLAPFVKYIIKSSLV